MTQFVHLRLHTEYSLLDGIVRMPELMAAVAAAAMPAVALTDQSNLFAMVKFYKEAQSAGVKPLIGVDAWIREPGERVPPSRIVLLCQDLIGYRHLTQLVTRSYLEGQHRGAPMFERAWLTSDTLRGLIALSGGPEGDMGRAIARGHVDEAARCLDAWRDLLGDRFYIEVQRTGRAGEQAYTEAALDLADSRGVAALATNDVRFLARADFEAHEARVCIHDGALLADPSRPRRYSEEQYLKSPAEMAETFADAPELLANTVEVAKRCSLEIKLGASMLPAYPVPAGSTTEEFLRDESARGFIAQKFLGSASGGHRIGRQHRGAEFDLERTALCDLDGIGKQLGRVGESFSHLGRGFQILLFGIAPWAARIGEQRAVVDADARLVRLEVGARQKSDVVGRERRHAARVRQVQRSLGVGLFSRPAGTLHLDIKPIA